MAMYLLTGMADVARETGGAGLYGACRTIWNNVVSRRMCVTGGLGSSAEGERFTIDHDLPNDTAYTETCAAIGLVFWAQRMLEVEGDGHYADVMERALYNGTVSGLSLKGDRFSTRTRSSSTRGRPSSNSASLTWGDPRPAACNWG